MAVQHGDTAGAESPEHDVLREAVGSDDSDGPIRTCIGCRGRAPRSSLLRVVTRAGVVEPDPSATAPGRGAWLHPDCLDVAERKRAFARALRATAPLDLDRLHRYLTRAGESSDNAATTDT